IARRSTSRRCVRISWRRTVVVLLSFPPDRPTAVRSPPRKSIWRWSSCFTRRSTNSRKWFPQRCWPLYRTRVTAGAAHFEQSISSRCFPRDIRVAARTSRVRREHRDPRDAGEVTVAGHELTTRLPRACQDERVNRVEAVPDLEVRGLLGDDVIYGRDRCPEF